MAAARQEIFERYPDRGVFRLYLSAAAATALAVSPDAQGRVYIDTNDARIDAITTKAGWFVVQGGANARQQYYLNTEHVIAVVFNSDEDLPSEPA